MEYLCVDDYYSSVKGRKVCVSDSKHEALLFALAEIQKNKSFVSDIDIQKVAGDLHVSPAELYSVISFCPFLNFDNSGDYIIRVSLCMANLLAGAEKVLHVFESVLGIKSGSTTKNGRISLYTARCLGRCEKAPVFMINDRVYEHVTAVRASKIAHDVLDKTRF